MKNSYLFLLCAVTMASVMMLTISSCGDKDEDINIVPNFEVSFQDGNDVAPATILIENKTTGANAYKWTFTGGNPSESLEQNPGPVSYATAGEYTISLTAYYNAESKPLSKTITVKQPENVVSNFSVSFAPTTRDYAPAQVTFTDESANAESYSWTFENGNPATSTQQNPPVVTFADYGLHNVTLTASNAGGSHTKTQSLKIYPGELVCNSNEYWEGPLMYPNVGPIGSIQYRFAADRSGGTSGTRIYVSGEAIAAFTGSAAQDVIYQLPLNWDWLIDNNGKQQLKVEVDVNGNKGTETSDFALGNGGFALTNTVLDAALQTLLTLDGAALLIPILQQDIVYTKKNMP